MNITAEIINTLGDSYKLKEIIRQTSCFSGFNCSITSSSHDIGSIILEKNKIDQLGIEDLKYFLENIKLAGTLDFKIIEKNDEIHLEFDSKDCKVKSYYQYTGMLVRCSYNNRSDTFLPIGKHFINMCKYFPKTDRGKLFTIACNIYLSNNTTTGYSYNSNHILMLNAGCKILTTKKIKELLDLNNGINDNFTLVDKLHNPDKIYIENENGMKLFNKDNPPKYNPKAFKKDLFNLENNSKESYLKIIKNGTK